MSFTMIYYYYFYDLKKMMYITFQEINRKIKNGKCNFTSRFLSVAVQMCQHFCATRGESPKLSGLWCGSMPFM